MPCRISTNGLTVKLNALIDTRAGSYVLVHPKHLRTIKKKLHAPIYNMEAIPLAGYDNRPNGQVDEYTQAHLVLDGHRLRTYFVFCNTGRHDMIIGRKLLEDADVWLNCKQQSLRWPDDAKIDYKRDIAIPAQRGPSPGINPVHEADADRRDRQMNISILQRSRKRPTTQRATARENLRKMNEQLHPRQLPEIVQRSPRRQLISRETFAKAGLEINTIGAAAFMMHARQKDTILGHISVYEVDKLIQDRKEDSAEDPEAELRRLIEEKLPRPGYAGATLAHFSKKDSDELPPYRKDVDHKIELISENTLTTSPLYSMSLEQLELVKSYLDDHLRRGFITHSDASYASPVLFAKKPGGGWRFCVDYRKLNV